MMTRLESAMKELALLVKHRDEYRDATGKEYFERRLVYVLGAIKRETLGEEALTPEELILDGKYPHPWNKWFLTSNKMQIMQNKQKKLRKRHQLE